MLEGYSDRMLRAPRFVREGNRLIPEGCVNVPRPEGSQGRPPARRGVSAANNSPEDEGADAPSQDIKPGESA